jgi:4-amino-4-deoxy-L-arabinose transferase-like glycosyltransferase
VSKLTRTHSYRFIIRLAIIATGAVVISLLAAYYTRHPVLPFDESYYYAQAESIANGDWQDGYIVRAPLYPLFLAGVFTLFGPGFWPALVVQSVLRGITVAGVGFLGRRYLTERAGLIAGLLVAVYPGMVLSYTRFMTEVIYIPVFLLSYHLVEMALNTSGLNAAAKAGAVSGAAALTRSVSFVFTLLIAAWLLFRMGPSAGPLKRRIALAAVLVGAMLAVLSPWVIRNTITHGGPILISNDTAFNLWLVISGEQIKEVTPEWHTWGTQAEKQAEAYRRWAAKLREDPTFHLRRIGKTLPRVFNQRWILPAGSLSRIRRNHSNRDLPALGRSLRILAPVLLFLVGIGGTIGVLVVERDTTRRNLILVTLVYFLLVHTMTLFRARFILPVQMLLAIYAAGLIDRGLSGLGLAIRGRRRGA